jgi:hypothetical protein
MYIPKPIRGQKYKGYIKVSLSQVRTIFKHKQVFNGFLVGNNVNTHHFHSGWHLACDIKKDSMEEFERTLNSFLFYLDYDLGSGAAIYLKED